MNFSKAAEAFFVRIPANYKWDIIADSERAFGGVPPRWEQGLEKLERYLLNSGTNGSVLL